MNEVHAKARALFEKSVQQLDEAAVRRLRLARRSALAATAPHAPRWFAWTAGLATAGALALGLAWWLPRPAPAPAMAAHGNTGVGTGLPTADAEGPVLAEADEDADLYAWLGEAPVAADGAEQRL